MLANSEFVAGAEREESMASRALRLVIVAALGVLVLCVFSVLAWLVLNRPLFFAPEPTQAPVSARQAHQRAQAVARDWQLDATLTDIRADLHATRLDQLGTDPPAWVITFYSPSAGERRNVVVSSSSARASAPERPRGLPPTVDLSQWQVESGQALSLFLAHGGREFMTAHEPVDLFLVLTLSESGRLQWIVVALDSADAAHHVVTVDATTGGVE
jgi:hypothetical protein